MARQKTKKQLGKVVHSDWCDRDAFIRRAKGRYTVTVKGDQLFARNGKLRERVVGTRNTYDAAYKLMGKVVCGRLTKLKRGR